MRIVAQLALSAALALPLLPAPAAAERKSAAEPEVIKVQHILIGFKRSIPGKQLERTKAEAEELAHALLERARGGEDFDALVREYTNDRHPGILVVINRDAAVRSGATRRDNLVQSFGDVAFSLGLGEIGLAEHHGGHSPYGWHVIKRLE